MYIINLLETQRGWTVDEEVRWNNEEVRCGIGVEELSVHECMNVKCFMLHVMYTGLVPL